MGEEAGEVEFKVFKDRALSNVSGAHVPGVSDHQYQVESIIRMPVRSVFEILQENNVPTAFELLSIDVEGNDLSALRSTRLDICKPKLIVIEMHDVDVGNVAKHDVAKYLAGYNYKPIAFQRSNAFFVLQ